MEMVPAGRGREEFLMGVYLAAKAGKLSHPHR
jgi:hypothetical protein